MSNKALTTPEFIARAVGVHGSRYSYDSTVYTRRKDPVSITCRLHGKFEQVAGVHLKGGNCPLCAREATNKLNTLTTEDFVARANKVHSGYYSYTDCCYKSMRSNVTVTCPEHGKFEQKARVHVAGHGCPSCAAYGFDLSSPAVLYYVCVDSFVYKIGITNNSVLQRFINDSNDIRIIKTWDFDTGTEAKKEESRLHSLYSRHSYTGPKILVTGNTELYTKDVLGLDDQLAQMAARQKSMLESGASNLEEFGNMKVVDAEVVE